MIGWKADYGYWTGDVNQPISNISQLQILDYDTYWCIYDGVDLSQEPTTVQEFPFTIEGESQAINKLIQYFGDNYYRLYCFVTGTYGTLNRMEEWRRFLPSQSLMCQNVTRAFNASLFGETQNVGNGTVCYIKSLKRILYYRGSYKEIGKVNDDGTVERVYTFTSGNSVGNRAFTSFTGKYADFVCIAKENPTYEDLIFPRNIYYVNAELYTTANNPPFYNTLSYRIQVLHTDNNTYDAAMLVALFGDYVEPDYTPIPDIDDPFGPGGNSGPGDIPPGTFDDTSDPIPDSSLPTLSAANTGFTRIYNPTLDQVQDLAKYLWTEDTVIETIWNHIKQFFENPMEAIIGFNLVPCEVPDGGTQEFKIMYIPTGVQMTVAANQFVDVDCGTVALDRYYGSALDQSPYTKIMCYLPFIGMVHLNVDQVMGTTLQCKYRIDICSGSCVAKILVDGNVLYQYSGHCAITIPISSADFSSYVSAAISVAKLAAAASIAGAGAGAAVAGVAEASTVTAGAATQFTSGGDPNAPAITTNFVGYSPTTQIHDMKGGAVESVRTPVQEFAGYTPANVANTAIDVVASKVNIEHTGSFSGNSGYLGVRRPYLLIERPRQCYPEMYAHFNGFPAMITMVLGECKGFTRVQQVQLNGIDATQPEQSEIIQLLKSGVYL